MRSLALALVLASALPALVACSSDDPQPGDGGGGGSKLDARFDTGGGGGKDGGASPADSGPTYTDGFTGAVSRACAKIVPACKTKLNAGGDFWNASVKPWSQAACEAVPKCVADKTTNHCFVRLATYWYCLAQANPIDCAGCFNAFQFMQGACPCIKACDPSCP